MVAQTRELGPADLDRGTLDDLRAEMSDVETHLVPLRAALADDPLVGLARGLPLSGDQVRAADELVAAADELLAAGDTGLGVAERVVTLREADAADDSTPTLPGLVSIVSDSRDDVDVIAAHLDSALAHLDAIPAAAIGPLQDARAIIADPLLKYRPLLESYQEIDDVVPGILGLGEEQRYLILAQNPAELRPAGGYAGTIGTLGIDDGAIVEQAFRDVYDIDLKQGLPWVEPPEELAHHLLGEDQSVAACRRGLVARLPDRRSQGARAL